MQGRHGTFSLETWSTGLKNHIHYGTAKIRGGVSPDLIRMRCALARSNTAMWPRLVARSPAISQASLLFDAAFRINNELAPGKLC
jgi:hypothetical protein